MTRSRRSNKTVNSNYATRKDDRDYVAIVSKVKMVGIWTGNEETSKYEMAPNDRDTRLGALRLFSEILDKIPTNDELLDKQVAIYALNCVSDCFTRPGDVYRSNISEEAKELIPEIIEKYYKRCYNCFIVPESNSNATIVREGFAWLEEMAERKLAEVHGVVYDKPQDKTEASVAHKSPLQVQEDKLNAAYDELDEAYDNDDEDKAAKIESKIARIKARIAEMKAENTVKAQA